MQGRQQAGAKDKELHLCRLRLPLRDDLVIHVSYAEPNSAASRNPWHSLCACRRRNLLHLRHADQNVERRLSASPDRAHSSHRRTRDHPRRLHAAGGRILYSPLHALAIAYVPWAVRRRRQHGLFRRNRRIASWRGDGDLLCRATFYNRVVGSVFGRAGWRSALDIGRGRLDWRCYHHAPRGSATPHWLQSWQPLPTPLCKSRRESLV